MLSPAPVECMAHIRTMHVETELMITPVYYGRHAREILQDVDPTNGQFSGRLDQQLRLC